MITTARVSPRRGSGWSTRARSSLKAGRLTSATTGPVGHARVGQGTPSGWGGSGTSGAARALEVRRSRPASHQVRDTIATTIVRFSGRGQTRSGRGPGAVAGRWGGGLEGGAHPGHGPHRGGLHRPAGVLVPVHQPAGPGQLPARARAAGPEGGLGEGGAGRGDRHRLL